MLNDLGHVLPCDASHDCGLRLHEAVNFYDIWNSAYYQNLRRSLASSGRADCFDHCHRANPYTVNMFESHVIHRGKGPDKISILWADNL